MIPNLFQKVIDRTVFQDIYVEFKTEVRFKLKLNLSLTSVQPLAFILGTVGEEVYHLRL